MQWLCDTYYTWHSTPHFIIQDTQPLHRTVISRVHIHYKTDMVYKHFPFIFSLSLLRLNTHRYSILLANKLHEDCSNNLPQERNSRRAHVIPYLDADGTQGRAWERQYPLHVVREPVCRQCEDGGLGVPELQEDFEAVCAEPPGAFDAPVERGFLGGDGFVCGRAGG